MKKWAGVLLAFLLLLGATASAAVQIGDRAEDFSIVNSDGTVSTLSLMLAQKKAVYVYFWASWCDMSREELPVVQAMYDQYGGDCGFIVASVEAEDTVFSQGAYSFDDVDRAEFGGAQFGMAAAAKPKRKHGKVVALVIGIIVALLIVIGVLIFMLNS